MKEKYSLTPCGIDLCPINLFNNRISDERIDPNIADSQQHLRCGQVEDR
jgi:hypothetical protein